MTRFAVQASFKFAGYYQFTDALIVFILPVAGYFIAVKRIENQLREE